MSYKMLSIILSSSLALLGSINAMANPQSQSSAPSANSLNQHQQQVTWLGVYLAPVPHALRAQLTTLLPANGGAMIQKVQDSSPAQAAGLKEFDIITHIDGNAVTQVQHVYEAVQSRKANEVIRLSIVQNARSTDIDVKLGSRQITPPTPSRTPFGNNFPFGNNNNPFGHSPFSNNNNFFWGTPNHFTFPQSQPNWPSFNAPTIQLPNFPSMSNAQSFSQTESMSMKTLPDGKVHIKTKSKDKDGNTKEFIFEGDTEDVKKQIEENKDLPENQKRNLLQSLSMNPGSFFNQNFMQGFSTSNSQTLPKPQLQNSPQPLPRGTLN